MTDRLKAWCHWKRREKYVSEDDMLMVHDIEALIEVAKAALAHLPYIPSGDLFGAGKYSEHNVSAHKLREALKKLESIE